MTPAEVIAKDCEKRGLDAQHVLANVAALVKQHNATLLHHGKTVLLLRGIGNNNAELHLFTDDKVLALLKALRVFVRTIRHSKVNSVYGSADNQKILDLLNKANVEILPSDLAQYNWMAKV